MRAFPDGIGQRQLKKGASSWLWLDLPLLILGAIVLLGLFGFLGGGPSQSRTVRAPAADLTVHTPHTLRSGLLFETRFAIVAHRDLRDATIALAAPLWKDLTINTTKPEAAEESFEDGAWRLHYGPMRAGERIEAKIDGQVNPPLTGALAGNVSLLDGETRLADMPLKIRIMP